MSGADYQTQYDRFVAAGQGQVFTFYEELSTSEQQQLLTQLAGIDPEEVNAAYRRACAADAAASSASADKDDIQPPPHDLTGSPNNDPASAERWSQVGMEAIRGNKVGVILLAGGQGTRLGSSDPKGCYDIGLLSKKSLFQLQGERIAKLQLLAGPGTVIPWYIMTSGPTRRATEAFFEQHEFFGLDKQNVVFFDQGVLPCLDNDGRILLESKSSVAVAPDGNGGIYPALRSEAATKQGFSVLSDMARRGVQYLYTYCVDNCLAKVCDPVFLGYCISKNSACGTKVVKKTNPNESVGVVALRNREWNVIEYSEISKELSEATEPGSSQLLFRAANIANHFYTLSFLQDVQSFSSKMSHHIARKKIPHVDLSSGAPIKPVKPNGMKLEQFIFDVLPFVQPLEKHGLFEVSRNKEFSPLKNALGTGSDDPQTSRRDILNLMREWLRAAGAEVTEDVEVEISPLVSYNGEGLEEHVKGKKLKSGYVATSDAFDSVIAA